MEMLKHEVARLRPGEGPAPREHLEEQTAHRVDVGLHGGRETLDLLNGQWSSDCSAPIAEAGLSVALRWFSLAGWDGLRMLDAVARYKLAGGTRSLIEAMVADGQPDLLLSAAVSTVEQDAGTVSVTTRDGRTFAEIALERAGEPA